MWIGRTLDAILEWAEDHPKFNVSMIADFKNILESGQRLSVRQVDAVNNIIERWKIPVEEEEFEDENFLGSPYSEDRSDDIDLKDFLD